MTGDGIEEMVVLSVRKEIILSRKKQLPTSNEEGTYHAAKCPAHTRHLRGNHDLLIGTQTVQVESSEVPTLDDNS